MRCEAKKLLLDGAFIPAMPLVLDENRRFDEAGQRRLIRYYLCAGADGTPTLIFDEVDTGISGRTAVIVGERLYSVARSRQVLSITHLPQIAAFADCHLFVEKHSDSEKTKTSLRELNNAERSAELARIMGASEADESAQKYASELIESANRFKLSKVNELD